MVPQSSPKPSQQRLSLESEGSATDEILHWLPPIEFSKKFRATSEVSPRPSQEKIEEAKIKSDE